MPIDALLFDKDGTLFDFSATWGAFGRSFLIRLADGDKDHASYLGQKIGFDLRQCVYAIDSIVIASTVGEIAQALVPYVPAVSHAELVEMLNDESKLAPQIPAVPLAPLLS
ncbi:MAG: HAD family hydrolase, partial [Ruegeria sp.]